MLSQVKESTFMFNNLIYYYLLISNKCVEYEISDISHLKFP